MSGLMTWISNPGSHFNKILMKIPRSPVTKGQDRREALIPPSAATPGDTGVANPHYGLSTRQITLKVPQ